MSLLIRELKARESLDEARNAFFEGQPPQPARAPGRLDVLGGIADYSGALVLQTPTAEATRVWALPTNGPGIECHTWGRHEITGDTGWSGSAAAWNPPEAASFPNAEETAHLCPKESVGFWMRYVFGCLGALSEHEPWFSRGWRIWIESEVPWGKGVSSSASLEMALLSALHGHHPSLPAWRLPHVGQRAENHWVGAPCGLMDQLATFHGQKGRLLPILCRPDQVGSALSLPAGFEIVGLDSGHKHAVSGSVYGSVRCATFMAWALVQKHAHSRDAEPGARLGEALPEVSPPYEGCITGVSPSLWESRFRKAIPESIPGSDFLALHGEPPDAATRVEAGKAYHPRRCGEFPIREHHRARTVAALLEGLTPGTPAARHEEAACLLGEAMNESHLGYGSIGLGHSATDAIWEMAQEVGPAQGIYGARISGGGSGGTVVLLVHTATGLPALEAIHRAAEKRADKPLVLFRGSSEGAATPAHALEG